MKGPRTFHRVMLGGVFGSVLSLTACTASGSQFQAEPAGAAQATCDDPVYLAVWIENLDRSKSAAYGKALRESGIVARNGGEYLLVSPPTLLIEGDWPEDRGFVVERYPCRAAFDAMWYSDEYQKVLKPLREGSGDYTVALFEDWPPNPPPQTE